MPDSIILLCDLYHSYNAQMHYIIACTILKGPFIFESDLYGNAHVRIYNLLIFGPWTFTTSTSTVYTLAIAFKLVVYTIIYVSTIKYIIRSRAGLGQVE